MGRPSRPFSRRFFVLFVELLRTLRGLLEAERLSGVVEALELLALLGAGLEDGKVDEGRPEPDLVDDLRDGGNARRPHGVEEVLGRRVVEAPSLGVAAEGAPERLLAEKATHLLDGRGRPAETSCARTNRRSGISTQASRCGRSPPRGPPRRGSAPRPSSRCRAGPPGRARTFGPSFTNSVNVLIPSSIQLSSNSFEARRPYQ